MIHLKQYLVKKDWETSLLGVNVYTLSLNNLNYFTNRAKLEASLPSNSLVSIRIKSDKPQTFVKLSNLGFYYIETYQILASNTKLNEPFSSYKKSIKALSVKDIKACQQIAKQSFAFDRFHQDPNLNKTKADLLKADWITNSLKGRCLFVLGKFNQKTLTGFIAVKQKKQKAFIDLIAISKNFRQQGTATQLIKAAKHKLQSDHHQFFVGTQANNLASVNCYLKNQFLLYSTLITFHFYKP